MAIKVREFPDSQRLTGVSSFVWKYLCVGTDIIDEVADAVYAASPPSYGFWVRDWSQKSITPDPNGGGRWEVEVPYNTGAVPTVWFPSQGPGGGSGGGVGEPGGGGGGYTLPGDEEALGPEWSGDFTAGSQQLRRSRSVVGGKDRWLLAGGPIIGDLAPIAGGGPIGFDPSTGNVEGVACPVGVQTKTIELKMPYITPKFERRVELYQFNVNSEAIFGRAAGEVRFEGARTQFRHADGAAVILTFGITKNHINLEVGRFLVLDLVEGLDYVDPTYTWVPDPDDSTKLVREVTRATIHRVHPRADLNDLFA